MEKTDVLAYHKAKKQAYRRKLGLILAVMVICGYVVLRVLGYDSIYLDAIVLGTFFGNVLANSDVIGWGNVTRNDLLEIIERQINQDAVALQILAEQDAA